MAAGAGQGPDGAFNDGVTDAPEDAVSTTSAEGGSSSALTAIPEENGSDFSGHIPQVTLAAWHEVEGAEDLTQELNGLESDDGQQMTYAAVDNAAA
eukprot:7688839-Pyramimonas_sp.AAC.1